MKVATQPDNYGFGFAIPLPDISLDLQASRAELNRLLKLAEVKHFGAHEYGRHFHPSWDGPNHILPANVALFLPSSVFMDMVRDVLGTRIDPSSTFRCAAYNVRDGQSDRSKHLWATAGDMKGATGVPALQRAVEYLLHPDRIQWVCAEIARRCKLAGLDVDPDTLRFGYGVYSSFVHIDVTQEGVQPYARRTLVHRFR